MRAKTEAVYLGCTENSFKDKQTGETIKFRRASFSVRDSSETFVLGVPNDVDISPLVQYADAYILVDFLYDQASNKYKGRLVNIYPDAKTMGVAPMLSQSESRQQ